MSPDFSCIRWAALFTITTQKTGSGEEISNGHTSFSFLQLDFTVDLRLALFIQLVILLHSYSIQQQPKEKKQTLLSQSDCGNCKHFAFNQNISAWFYLSFCGAQRSSCKHWHDDKNNSTNWTVDQEDHFYGQTYHLSKHKQSTLRNTCQHVIKPNTNPIYGIWFQ